MVAVDITCGELLLFTVLMLSDGDHFLRPPRNKVLSLTMWTFTQLSKPANAKYARNGDGRKFSSKLFMMSLIWSSLTSISNYDSFLATSLAENNLSSELKTFAIHET